MFTDGVLPGPSARKLQTPSSEGRNMRWWLSYVLTVLLLASFGARAQDGIELRGNLNANDTEREEGYFAVAQDTVLMVRPGSDLHRWLKDHAGQTVRIIVEPAATVK